MTQKTCPTCKRDGYGEWIVPSREPLPPHEPMTSGQLHAYYKTNAPKRRKRR